MNIYIIRLPHTTHHWFLTTGFIGKPGLWNQRLFMLRGRKHPTVAIGFYEAKKCGESNGPILWFCGDVVAILDVGVSGVSWLGRQVGDLYWKAWGIRGSLFVLKLWVGVVRWRCRPWDLPCNCGSSLREIGRYRMISVDVRDEYDLKWFWFGVIPYQLMMVWWFWRVWWWLPMCLAA